MTFSSVTKKPRVVVLVQKIVFLPKMSMKNSQKRAFVSSFLGLRLKTNWGSNTSRIFLLR